MLISLGMWISGFKKCLYFAILVLEQDILKRMDILTVLTTALYNSGMKRNFSTKYSLHLKVCIAILLTKGRESLPYQRFVDQGYSLPLNKLNCVMKKKRNRFLIRNKEDDKLNQYWYSLNTIETIINEIEENVKPTKCAFISTPSLFFSLKNKDLIENSIVLDFDKKWKKKSGFVFYDYNEPEKVDKAHHGTCDFIIIDPPFITREVWECYAKTAKLLGGENAKIVCTTVAENKDMMKILLGVKPQIFKPSIPNLVYQYDLYCNYESTGFSIKNAELEQ